MTRDHAAQARALLSMNAKAEASFSQWDRAYREIAAALIACAKEARNVAYLDVALEMEESNNANLAGWAAWCRQRAREE